MQSTGIRGFTMAFILSSGGCEPAWDGQRWGRCMCGPRGGLNGLNVAFSPYAVLNATFSPLATVSTDANAGRGW